MAVIIRGGQLRLKGVVHIFSGGTTPTTPTDPGNGGGPHPSIKTAYMISVSPSTGSEGTAAGTGSVFTFTVERAGLLTKESRVSIALSGSATLGTDYTVSGLTGGNLFFPAGASSVAFTASTVPDANFEGNETITASLTEIDSDEQSEFGISSATATILNDDAAPQSQPPVYAISASPTSGPEGNPGGSGTIFSFTVSRSGDVSQPGSVTVSFGGTASPNDYTTSLTSGTISFQAGETMVPFIVTSTPDTMVESSETVIANLGVITGGGTLGTASATVLIENDDTATSTGNTGTPVTDGNGDPIVDPTTGEPIYTDSDPLIRQQDNSGYVQSQDGARFYAA